MVELEDIITYSNYYESLKKCNKGVNFKLSVQTYNENAVFNIVKVIKYILDGNIPEVVSTKKITIRERGKERVITPIEMTDRITQRVICDKALVPSIRKHLIYDNGASMPNKGTEFARKRMEMMLEKVKRRYGADNVYVLTFDFKSYFDSIPHRECVRALDKLDFSDDLKRLIIGIIESYKLGEINELPEGEREEQLKKLYNHELRGLCLGSQISQIMALMIPNDIDHYIKDKLGLMYERFQDDGVVFSNNREELFRLRKWIKEKADEIGLTLHPHKTRVIKVTEGFTFLKNRYYFVGNKTIKNVKSATIVRQRRKLKKFHGLLKRGKMSQEDIFTSMQSWLTRMKMCKSYHSTMNVLRLYDKLFGGYKITRKYFKDNRNEHRKRKYYK